MPEGPEVAQTAYELDAMLKGQSVVQVKILLPLDRNRQLDCDKVPPFSQICGVRSRGKKIIFELFNCGCYFYWITSLIMTGHWSLEKNESVLQNSHVILAWQIAQVLDSTKQGNSVFNLIYDEQWLVYSDYRRMGYNQVYSSFEELTKRLKDIGPDLLQDSIDFNSYYNVINRIANDRRSSEKQVCEFLMDQKYFSGIGNYLMAEICYRAGIHPARKITSLERDEIERLWFLSLSVSRASLEAKGLTISDYSTPLGARGTFNCCVYKEEFDPFGAPVETATFRNGRTSHFVPSYFDSTGSYIGPSLDLINEIFALDSKYNKENCTKENYSILNIMTRHVEPLFSLNYPNDKKAIKEILKKLSNCKVYQHQRILSVTNLERTQRLLISGFDFDPSIERVFDLWNILEQSEKIEDNVHKFQILIFDLPSSFQWREINKQYLVESSRFQASSST